MLIFLEHKPYSTSLALNVRDALLCICCILTKYVVFAELPEFVGAILYQV